MFCNLLIVCHRTPIVFTGHYLQATLIYVSTIVVCSIKHQTCSTSNPQAVNTVDVDKQFDCDLKTRIKMKAQAVTVFSDNLKFSSHDLVLIFHGKTIPCYTIHGG